MKSCGRPWSVCEIVSVLYGVAVTVMHVLLFVLHVSMMRECEGARVIGRVLDVCLCLGFGGVGGVGEEWVGGLDQRL